MPSCEFFERNKINYVRRLIWHPGRCRSRLWVFSLGDEVPHIFVPRIASAVQKNVDQRWEKDFFNSIGQKRNTRRYAPYFRAPAPVGLVERAVRKTACEGSATGVCYLFMTDKRSKIILINGASSAGKSTLAKALQALVDEPFLRFSLDLLMFGGEVLPARRDTAGPFLWASMRPMLLDGYYRCLAALASAGNNIVVDYIIETQDQLDQLVYLLAPFDVFYVGLHCPLPELERRERQRGDRRIGDARRDHELVNHFGPYDAELDGMLSVDANAASLLAAWKARRLPGVFATRAAGHVE